LSIGRIHSDEEVTIKLLALVDECNQVYAINRLQRDNPSRIIVGLDPKIDSMKQLATELEREIRGSDVIKTNLEGDN
jgi:hypothetical protein